MYALSHIVILYSCWHKRASEKERKKKKKREKKKREKKKKKKKEKERKRKKERKATKCLIVGSASSMKNL